jgi:WD repeat-containing protein 49
MESSASSLLLRAASRGRVTTVNSASSDGDASSFEFTLEDLQRLKSYFDEAEEEGKDALIEEEFVIALGSIVEHKSKDEISMLFQTIDANMDGHIDWEEFSTFMLLENKGASEAIEDLSLNEFLPQTFPDPNGRAQIHRDMIEKLVHYTKTDRYMSCSRDGIIKFWNAKNLELTKSVRFAKSWITDVAIMPSPYNRVVVSVVDRHIAFLDLNTYERIPGLQDLKNAPICIDYWNVKGEEFIGYGDDHGNLVVHKPSTLTLNFESPTPLLSVDVHEDWINMMRYIPDIDAVVTCSSDFTLRITDVDRGKTKRILTGHQKGVYCFDWCNDYKFLVSCGQERYVHLWNPYMKKPMATLLGHASPVVQVVVNDAQNQIISLGSDKTLKVWDVRTHRCLQTLVDKQLHRPEDMLSALMFDHRNGCLVTASAHLSVWPMRRRYKDTENLLKSHENPLTCVLYNNLFRRIVSADDSGTVCVWDVESGKMLYRFKEMHGSSRITAMCFDAHGRRLVTGAHNGSIRVWNFNNGGLLKEMITLDLPEVTGLVHVDSTHAKFFISSHWGGHVIIWQDSMENGREVPWRRWKGHSDDILAVAFHAPHLVATASLDGSIIIWHVETGSNKMVLTACKGGKEDEATVQLLSPNGRKITGAPSTSAGAAATTSTTTSASTFSSSHTQYAPPQVDVAVDCILFLSHRSGALVSAGSDGIIRFWEVQGPHASRHPIYQCHAMHVKGEGIVAMCTDPTNFYLVTADGAGMVKVWDVSNFTLESETVGDKTKGKEKNSGKGGGGGIFALYRWRAHKKTISDVAFCDHIHMVVTASVDCTIKLWKLGAAGILPVGILGQASVWTWQGVGMKPVNEVDSLEGLEVWDPYVMGKKQERIESQRSGGGKKDSYRGRRRGGGGDPVDDDTNSEDDQHYSMYENIEFEPAGKLRGGGTLPLQVQGMMKDIAMKLKLGGMIDSSNTPRLQVSEWSPVAKHVPTPRKGRG